jgi:exopolysaccharide biosynthesis polyprenyl glycosylphosphotransferase
LESSVATEQHSVVRPESRVDREGRARRERSSILARSLAAADLATSILACIAVGLLAGLSPRNALALGAVAGLSYPLAMFTLGVYSVDDLRAWASGVSEAPKALVAALCFSWPLFAAAWLLEGPAGLVTGLGVLATLLLSAAARGGVRVVLHRSAPFRQRTVILGSGVVAGQLATKLKLHSQFGLVPVGLVDDDFHNIGSPDLPRLGGLRDLPEILDATSVDRVIIAFSRASHEELLSCIRICRDHAVAVDIVPRLFEFLDGARSLDAVGGIPLLSLGAPRLTRSSQVSKRALDVIVSLVGLICISPALALAAIAIRLESRGAVLFRQRRIGRGGREFDVLKFRSMYSDADEVKDMFAGMNDAEDGVMFKIRHDPRVTRVGRLLRRFSADELPQLWNVLKGEMSLVGPRPLIPQESAALAEDWHTRRLDLRPGITGVWQIQGRSESPFQEMVRFDYQYVSGWSLSRDVEILFATVPAVLSGRGAY